MKSLFTFVFLTLFSFNLSAQQLPVHGPSEEQLKAMALHNQQMATEEVLLPPLGKLRSSNIMPFYEYDTTGYIVMSDDDFYGVAEDMKKSIASNLPAGVTLMVYTSSGNKQYQQQLFNTYSQYIDGSRLKILQVPASGSNNFWTRDNLPLPVWEDGRLTLVDARYYYNFEPDAFFAQLFGTNILKHNYFFEGGNFMANARGDCLVVNRRKAYPGGMSDTGAIPDDIFKSKYGCKTLTRFKHLKGIGHIDEVVKFMSDDVVVTDTVEYKATLEKAGFTVLMLPEPHRNYETYVNSLIINDVVYVPIFGESGDQKALDTYAQLGFKVVGIQSQELATQGQGGIHCITMNYPAVPLANILRSLEAHVVSF